ncbi:MAG: flagellar basal-body MS-ring/collar protein FliF [Gammaproteobacteria bacterium]|nr:flagellar basal-body MS-ring/collar protein FliF [Gammaproteobacteria bacterium]MDH5728332.1 flagellar basal-body MS-ring/collar protein FliF [Gammaproteobacteria bacterium]
MAVANADPLPPDANLPATEVQSGLPVAEPVEAVRLNDLNNSQRLKERFKLLPKSKQLQLIIALALAMTLAIVVLYTSLTPDYKVLYGKLSEQASGQIVEVLEQEGISYKLDERSGQIMVQPDKIHDVRIMLASKGLPKDDGGGFEILQESSGFGTSQFIENARYFRALEGELGRSISEIDGVENSRVHLAIPKQSVFVRDRREPSASVLVNLSSGAHLSESKVSAIVHLVAASIPDLKADNVTVVDHTGKMLTKKDMPGDLALSTAQFDYKRKLEQAYIDRIEGILNPIVGVDGVRAQVDANIDFAVTESTQETFNPDLPAVRSEQTMEEESKGGDIGGIPGALTNQPPGVSTVPETLPERGGDRPESPSRKSKRSTFNYELDKTISHTKKAPGNLQRLSVAVVVDDKLIVNESGAMERVMYTPEELDRMTGLVKEAVGFSVQRGDSLSVINASFLSSQEFPELPPPPVWERPWFIDMAKQGGGILLAALLVLWLVRPVLRELTQKEEVEDAEDEISEEELEATPEDREAIRKRLKERGALSAEDWASIGITKEEYEEMLNALRQMVVEDPLIVAQVVKTWVATDEMAERQNAR